MVMRRGRAPKADKQSGPVYQTISGAPLTAEQHHELVRQWFFGRLQYNDWPRPLSPPPPEWEGRGAVPWIVQTLQLLADFKEQYGGKRDVPVVVIREDQIRATGGPRDLSVERVKEQDWG